MKQRIVIKIGYQALMLGENADVGAVLSGLSGASQIEWNGSWWNTLPDGIKATDDEVEIKIIPEHKIRQFADDKTLALSEDLNKANSRYYEELSTRKKIEGELTEIKEKFAPFMEVEDKESEKSEEAE